MNPEMCHLAIVCNSTYCNNPDTYLEIHRDFRSPWHLLTTTISTRVNLFWFKASNMSLKRRLTKLKKMKYACIAVFLVSRKSSLACLQTTSNILYYIKRLYNAQLTSRWACSDEQIPCKCKYNTCHLRIALVLKRLKSPPVSVTLAMHLECLPVI